MLVNNYVDDFSVWSMLIVFVVRFVVLFSFERA